MSGTCGTRGEKRNAYTVLVGKPEGKRPLTSRIKTRTWEYHCKMALKQTGYDGQRPLYPVPDPTLLYLYGRER